MATIKSQRQVLLSHGEDGYFVVKVPSLPGCISQGKTREEALAIDFFIYQPHSNKVKFSHHHNEHINHTINTLRFLLQAN